jgi:hypothetical protein
MVDRQVLLIRLDAERRNVAYDGLVLESAPPVTRCRATDGSHHTIIHSSLTAASADDVIVREIEHHRKLGASFEWKLYAHDMPDDLRERLVRHDFSIGPCEAVLTFDLWAVPPAWIEPDANSIVRRTDSVQVIEDFRRVAEAVFDKDYSFTTRQLLDALHAGSTQHRGYVAYANGGADPVSIGRLYTHHDSVFGGLYGGGTLPAFRGRGYYHATVAARARDAVALGAKYLVIDALPTSRPIVERLGVKHVTDTWPCEWRPSSAG